MDSLRIADFRCTLYPTADTGFYLGEPGTSEQARRMKDTFDDGVDFGRYCYCAGSAKFEHRMPMTGLGAAVTHDSTLKIGRDVVCNPFEVNAIHRTMK